MSSTAAGVGFWLLCAGLAVVAGCASSTPVDDRQGVKAKQWAEDLAYLVETLETVHPDLYARVDRRLFAERAEELRTAIPELSEDEIIVRLMQLVALVQDGHTSLDPVEPAGFGSWYPVRFYRFRDGIFITAIDRGLAEYAGTQVVRIGNLPAEEGWKLTASLLGADNAFGTLHRAPLFLSNATALHALGVTEGTDRLPLGLRRDGGEIESVEVPVVEAEFDLSFQFWGEHWGPASSEVEYVTAFDGRPSGEFYDEESDLPLHLRYRSAYWFTYLEERRLFYVQINYMGDSGRRGQTFEEFNASLWRAVDGKQIDFFVVDNRYNIGGDGSLVNPFVHEIIKRDAMNQKGKLFVVVGRATFSAGVMLTRALEEHTEATFVGEPPGAYWQHYGDGTSFRLPHGDLEVWVSTIYHQLSSYADGQTVMPIELPAPFTSADYFGGRDPALDQILTSRTRPLLAHVFRHQGGAAALALHEERLEEYGGVDWWAPFSIGELDRLGDELLASERGEDALAAYQLNARRHPDHWRVWSSLGEAFRELGDKQAAIANFEKALAVDPFNNLAPLQRERLAELRGEGE